MPVSGREIPAPQEATAGIRAESVSATRFGRKVLGSFIDVLTWEQAIDRLIGWASQRESRYVCICNVHSVVTAGGDHRLQKVISEADMATPDGMPIAWMLRALGFPGQARINGPDLMWKLCARAETENVAIYLLGGKEETLAQLSRAIGQAFPRLRIAGSESPPFRPLSPAEEGRIVARINGSGASILFVGLGCPKQEFWMSARRGAVNAVMIGVGAAFDYHAGTLSRAPLWMQRNGLEWLFRLGMEPRRLWRRYLVTNTLFLFRAARQLLFASK